MIYLASPYGDPSPAVRGSRYIAASIAAAELMKRGYVVFSPIAHSHSIALAGDLPTAWDYWEKINRKFLAVCDCVLVLRLVGWKQSTDVAAEIAIANKMEKHVIYADPDAMGDCLDHLVLPGAPL